MGLIEACPRSATALALEDGTILREIKEEEFYAFFQNDPERLLQILRQLSARIRECNEKYGEVCRALSESEDAGRAGVERSDELDQKLAEISLEADRRKSSFSHLHSSFYDYVQADLDSFYGKREVVRVSVLERLIVRKVSPKEMHVNPDDEFSDPDIGPNDRIISEYCNDIDELKMYNKDIFPEPIMVYKMALEGYLILNGHHRWAASMQRGLDKVRVAILNPPK